MRVFLTGGTGFIGSQLAHKLAEDGSEVHALVRSVERAQKELNHPNIILFEGELDDSEVIKVASEECEQAYLLAAYAQVWHKDPDIFYKINERDNLNLIKELNKCGVKKIVVTSTAGVFGPSKNGELITESSKLWTDLTTHYEKSKAQAEKGIKEYVKSTSANVVIVNPTRVYGPGKLSSSNSVTRMIKEYYEGTWHVYPGNGKASGNYVFVEDVINGLLLAMTNGMAGESYILGGENASYREIFQKVTSITGKKTWLIGIPIGLMFLIAKFQTMLIPITGKGPLLTKGFVKKYTYSWVNDHLKAKKDLGYSARSLNEGIECVVKWIKEKNEK